MTRLQDLGFFFDSAGNLLTPDAKKISLSTPPQTMALVQHFYYWRVNTPKRYIAVVFAPTTTWMPQVSIMTEPDRVEHTIVVADDDLAPTIEILKQLLDDTIAASESPRS